MSQTEVTGIIPARYGSTRFPGKPLAEILGRPMIQWVAEAAQSAEEMNRVVVATDDEDIRKTVEEFGGEARMTPSDCPSGSDRVSRVAREIDTDLVVNIQGDEPLIRGNELDRGIRNVIHSDDVKVGSFMAPCPPEARDDPDDAKVVVDRFNRALYFSRSPVPFEMGDPAQTYQHIGIYIFGKDFLHTFQEWDPTPLERSENLEQLRILEHGHSILMTKLDEPTVGVDRPGDVGTVESILRDRGYQGKS